MLHERANNERFREATVVQVGLLIADILSRMKRERERERKIEKFFSLECTIALRLTVCSLVLLERRQRSLSRLVIFSSAERREARGFVLVARDKKDLGILGARCHRHSHRSHPIIFKLSKRALRPYIRPDNVSCVCEHVSK